MRCSKKSYGLCHKNDKDCVGHPDVSPFCCQQDLDNNNNDTLHHFHLFYSARLQMFALPFSGVAWNLAVSIFNNETRDFGGAAQNTRFDKQQRQRPKDANDCRSIN